MKHKIITLILTLCLILPTCNIVWADTTSENKETLNSAATSSQTPQVSENEVAAAVENVQVEEQVEDETPELQFPHTITVYFYYKNAKGELISQKASNTFKKETDGWSKAVSYFERQLKNNHLDVVNVGLTTYTFTGQWVGDNGEVLTSSDRVSFKGNTYGKDTTINYYAQYTETQKHKIDFYAIDNVGHTSGSASNLGVIESYTHTFKTPADVPVEYEFLYWKNFENGDIKNPGEELTVDATQLEEDITITYYAVYEYQPSIRVIYHNGDSITDTGSQREPIQINNDMYWFLEGSEEPIVANTVIELPEKVTTTEKLDIEEVTNVYAHYFTVSYLPGEFGDFEPYEFTVDYGTETPIVTEILGLEGYEFIGWDKEIAETVTENMCYTALWKEIQNIEPIEPTDSVDPVDPVIDKPEEPIIPDVPDEPEKPIIISIDEPIDKSINEPIDEPINEPTIVNEPINESIVQPVEKPIIKEKEVEYTEEKEIKEVEETVDEPRPVVVTRTRTTPVYIPYQPARETYIIDSIEETPTTSIEQSIEKEEEKMVSNEVPTTNSSVETTPMGSWALINLISLIATILLSIMLLILALFNKIKESENKIDNKMLIRIITLIISIIALLIFIFTENIFLPMILVDKWTIVMILILIVQVILTYKSKHEIKKYEE